MSQFSPVTFHGDTIFCITLNDQPYVPVKPIAENLGLAWQAQAAKLSANKDRWSVSIIETVAQDGRNRETLCIPVRKLPALLASINPKLDNPVRFRQHCPHYPYWQCPRRWLQKLRASLPGIMLGFFFPMCFHLGKTLCISCRVDSL